MSTFPIKSSWSFGAKVLGPSSNAHCISLIVPRNTDLKRIAETFLVYFIAYFKANVAPHDPPTIKNFFMFKNSLIFSTSSTKLSVLFPIKDLYGVLLPHPL